MAESSELEKREHLRKIINKAGTGMFVTRTADGGMHGRPMANAQVQQGMSEIWFATSRSSAKVDELARDDHVLVGYGIGSGSEWATVTGRARTVDDRAKIKQLWEPMWKNWWDSPDDPDLILLHFIPEFGEYWDSGNKLVQLAKFAAGTITGKDTTRGDNEKLNLS